MLNFRPRALYALAKAFRMPWRSSAECAAITLSSVYCNSVIVVQLTLLLAVNLLSLKSLPSVLYMIGITLWQLFAMRWSMAAMKMANSVGAMTHPCLTPVSTVKDSDLVPPLLSTVTSMPTPAWKGACRFMRTQMCIITWE